MKKKEKKNDTKNKKQFYPSIKSSWLNKFEYIVKHTSPSDSSLRSSEDVCLTILLNEHQIATYLVKTLTVQHYNGHYYSTL